MAFQSIERNSISESWNGSSITLNPNDNVSMPQTPSGALVLAYQNTATQNNPGTLAITSGVGAPTILPAPALAGVPSILVMNTSGENLSIVNISPPTLNVPIWVEVFAPGLPGQACLNLPNDGTSISLETAQCSQATVLPSWMQIILQANTANPTVFAIIGGPHNATNTNAYVISINDAINGNTGYGTNPFAQPQAGYFATTSSNLFTYEINWGNSMLYIANMSSASTASGEVGFRRL